MYIHKTMAGWLSTSFLAASLVFTPLHQALAYAPQWRSVTTMQAPHVQQVTQAGRFRPVNPVNTASLGAAQQAAAPSQLAQAPVFARQYAWRPAPSAWSPKPRQQMTYAASEPYAHQQPQVASSMSQYSAAAQGRWRPIEAGVARAQVAASTSPNTLRAAAAPAPARLAGGIWRPVTPSGALNQPAVQQQPQQPVMASHSPFGYPPNYAYWPQQMHHLTTMPVQPVWPSMAMPWMPMHAPDYYAAYVPQPSSAYARMPYSAHAPMPSAPYYGHSAAMLRPRWVNGQVVWPHTSRDSRNQPALPVGKRALANRPFDPLCMGCDS